MINKTKNISVYCYYCISLSCSGAQKSQSIRMIIFKDVCHGQTSELQRVVGQVEVPNSLSKFALINWLKGIIADGLKSAMKD